MPVGKGVGKELSLSTPVTEHWMSPALPMTKDRPSLHQQFDVIIMWVLAVSPSKRHFRDIFESKFQSIIKTPAQS